MRDTPMGQRRPRPQDVKETRGRGSKYTPDSRDTKVSTGGQDKERPKMREAKRTRLPAMKKTGGSDPTRGRVV